MRIGFLSTVDPRDPGALSGMPFHMRRALARLGEVVDITPFPLAPPGVRELARLVPAGLRRLGRAPFARGAPRPPGPEESAAAVLAGARELSRRARAALAERQVDVLFGCCVSTLLAELHTDLPIVYASDTTARLIVQSYARYSRRPADVHAVYDALERAGLHAATRVVFATELARRSAVEDFGVDPARTHVVPLGANLTPARRHAAPPPISPPTRADLRLAFVGLDPDRKRLDLAVEAVAALRAAGWAATLEVIGGTTPRALASPWVRCLGTLDPASPFDRRTHSAVLLRSHLLLLPSAAEAYGIAPCEAAHHGRPSVVAGVGGLPEVVLDGETGAVLPRDASARDHARAILSLVEDPARYARVSAAALRRAHDVQCWERWGAALEPILGAAFAAKAARRVTAAALPAPARGEVDAARVSVVVAPKDTFSTVGPCFAALLEQLPSGVDVSLVTGGVPPWLLSAWRAAFAPRVRFVIEPELMNQSRARNLGLALARTPLCVLMDADVFGRDGWLPRLLEAQASTGAAVVVPTVLQRSRVVHCIGNDLYVTHQGDARHGHKVLRFHAHPFEGRVSVAAGPTTYGELHCQLVRVDAVQRAGGFDEAIHDSEVDLGLALQRDGELQWCEPGAVVQFAEDAPLRPEDVALYAWRWDPDAARVSLERFARKWGIDLTERGQYGRFLAARNARLGRLARLAPAAATLQASGLLDALSWRAARLVSLPGSLADEVRRRAVGPPPLACPPAHDVRLDAPGHPALLREWRRAG